MSDEVAAVRVHDSNGSHIEPALDESWSDLDKLRWQAAVVAVDTGLRVAVGVANFKTKRYGRWVPEDGYYNVSVGSSSGGAYTFIQAWLFLNGVSTGAEQAQRDAS